MNRMEMKRSGKISRIINEIFPAFILFHVRQWLEEASEREAESEEISGVIKLKWWR
jgi:hypothetical protein